MLFLLNDRVIEIEAPEVRVMTRWRELGCGDPRQLRAHDAIEFVKMKLQPLIGNTIAADADLLMDLAALVISKTGANSLVLMPTAGGQFEARLRDVPPLVLETFQAGAANDQDTRRRA